MNAQPHLTAYDSIENFTKLVLPNGKVIDLMDEDLLEAGLKAVAKVKQKYDAEQRERRIQQGF
jgi:hypothetical protein